MGKRNQVGDIISGFNFKDTYATKVRDGDWVEGHETEVEAKGEWLVVDSYLGGGGTGMGPHDIYPDVWHIVLQKLGRDRILTDVKKVRYTKVGLRPQSTGRQITVTQDTNCYSNCIPYVEPVARWQKNVKVEWIEKGK